MALSFQEANFSKSITLSFAHSKKIGCLLSALTSKKDTILLQNNKARYVIEQSSN